MKCIHNQEYGSCSIGCKKIEKGIYGIGKEEEKIKEFSKKLSMLGYSELIEVLLKVSLEKVVLEKQLAEKDKEIEEFKNTLSLKWREIEVLKEEIERLHGLLPTTKKHSHDHDYWHDDCYLCRQDKENYERTNP